MDWDKLLSKVSTKSDVATVLVFGTVGFAADALSTLHGVISPGYFAGLAASGALGAKNAIEAGWDSYKTRRLAKAKPESTVQNAKNLLRELEKDTRFAPQVKRLERDLDLFDKGLVTNEQLDATFREALDFYRI